MCDTVKIAAISIYIAMSIMGAMPKLQSSQKMSKEAQSCNHKMTATLVKVNSGPLCCETPCFIKPIYIIQSLYHTIYLRKTQHPSWTIVMENINLTGVLQRNVMQTDQIEKITIIQSLLLFLAHIGFEIALLLKTIWTLVLQSKDNCTTFELLC